MTYLVKFRRHVLFVRHKEGLTFEEASARFGIGRASLTRWIKRLDPDQSKPGKRKIDLDMPRRKRCFGIRDWNAKGRINVIDALMAGAFDGRGDELQCRCRHV